ncbi:hypothetical protein GGS26DRAFT_566019 [Hypomontagnella submonticulosa]|nr:hypothetical protein GGS26DRAFT_566019 [Hypomontagnella submonticulosa]
MCTLLAFLINPSNAAAETFATFPSYPGCLRGEPTEKELGANNGDMPSSIGPLGYAKKYLARNHSKYLVPVVGIFNQSWPGSSLVGVQLVEFCVTQDGDLVLNADSKYRTNQSNNRTF